MFNQIKNFFKGIFNKPIFINSGYSFNTVLKKDRDYVYGIVFRSIDTIANAVGAVKFNLYEEKDGQKIKRNDELPFKLIERPNSYFTDNDLLYLTTAHIITGGSAYWYLPRNLSGEIAEIWPLPPNRVIIKKGKNFIDGYIFINNAGQRIELTTDEVIPIYRPSPFDWWKGESLLNAIKYDVDADLSAILWNANFFKNGAIPSGAIEVDTPLTAEQAQMIRENLKELYMGRENAHKLIVLGRGQKYTQITPRQKDMDFIEQRKFSRDEILAIFNIPKSIVGITEDVNRANAETSNYIFAKRNVEPWLNLIFEKINTFYLPKFNLKGNYYFEYETQSFEDSELKLRRLATGVGRWITVNEARAEEGLPPIEGGDKLDLIDLGSDEGIKSKGLKNHKVYLIRKKRIIEKYQKDYNLKLTQLFKNLIRDIKKVSIAKVYKTKGSEHIVTYLTPLLNDFSVLLSKIIFDFGRNVSNDAVELNKDVYNIPKVDMGIITHYLNHRAKTTADDVKNTLLNRAREIIARNLEDDIIDPDKIINDVAETIDDEIGYRAERIVRTELSTTYYETTMLDYKNSDVVSKIKWIVGDNPCPECKLNENQIVNLGEPFNNGLEAPPTHPNCECDIVPVF